MSSGEIIGKGELFFLGYPGTAEIFSGYGLTIQPGSKRVSGRTPDGRPAPTSGS
jgi:hypothetical protein